MQPGQRGAIKLARVYGDQLLCVRYRENRTNDERITTVELVIERVVIQKRADDVVYFKIKLEEVDLRVAARAKGAVFDGKTNMWKLQRREVLRMGLRHRIAVPLSEIYQEQVLP